MRPKLMLRSSFPVLPSRTSSPPSPGRKTRPVAVDRMPGSPPGIGHVPHFLRGKRIHGANERAHRVSLCQRSQRFARLLGRRPAAEPAISSGPKRVFVRRVHLAAVADADVKQFRDGVIGHGVEIRAAAATRTGGNALTRGDRARIDDRFAIWSESLHPRDFARQGCPS